MKGELVAEALHNRGLRRHKPLIKSTVPGLSENLQEK
jgi:transcriptional regulator with GAF, ATPase, and Fis domain